jgi:breast cancer 2 susceptibility protein
MEKKFPIFDSPLKTSSVRTVNISSLGVSRAATLLGLEESTLSTQLFGQVGEKLGTKITVERENSECRLASGNAISVDSHKDFSPSEKRLYRHEQLRFSKSSASDSGEDSIRFSTAGGRSMAISSNSLQRAKNLLGELEDPQNDSAGCSLASASKMKQPNSSASKEKQPNSTIYPRDDPFLLHTSRPIGCTSPDTPATKHNANMLHVERECHAINDIPKVLKPPSRLSEGDTASDVKCNTRRYHTPTGALVDITNYMAPHSGNMDHFANGKRIMGRRNSISPFKRPRSSRSFDLHPV